MSHPLIIHIRKLVDLKVDDETAILSFFRQIEVRKKQNLIEAGHPCTTLFFVVKGCIRLYYLNEKGVEQTIQFAIENWWLTDFLAFPQQSITEFTIQAVENSQLLAIDTADQERMMDQYPQLERYFRLIYQRGYGASQVKMKYQYDYSREQLYRHFVDNFPEFTQRIPQYLLASYLGFTPEYLSELRKKRY